MLRSNPSKVASELLDDGGRLMALDGALAALPPERATELGYAQQTEQPMSERGGVAVVDQVPLLAVSDELRDAADGGRHDGTAGGHGFEQGVGRRLDGARPRGEDDDVDGAEEARDVDVTEKGHRVREPERVKSRLVRPAEAELAGDGKARTRLSRHHASDDLCQEVEPLLGRGARRQPHDRGFEGEAEVRSRVTLLLLAGRREAFQIDDVRELVRRRIEARRDRLLHRAAVVEDRRGPRDAVEERHGRPEGVVRGAAPGADGVRDAEPARQPCADEPRERAVREDEVGLPSLQTALDVVCCREQRARAAEQVTRHRERAPLGRRWEAGERLAFDVIRRELASERLARADEGSHVHSVERQLCQVVDALALGAAEAVGWQQIEQPKRGHGVSPRETTAEVGATWRRRRAMETTPMAHTAS